MKSFPVVVFFCLLTMSGCREKAPPDQPAAHVDNPVKETELTTVTLSPDAERRLGIAVVPVEERTVPPTRTFGGEVVAPPGQSFAIVAPVAGSVLPPADGTVPLPGTRVARGQALLRLVPLPPGTDLARGDEEVAVARVRAEQMRNELARAEDLARDSLISQRDLDRARTEYTAAETALAAAENRLRRQRTGTVDVGTGLTPLTITAPASGMVLDLSTGAGQIVAANAPLITVARLDRLWIKAPIFSGDASLVAPGAMAEVDLLENDEEKGSIPARRVVAPPSADPASSSVDLFFELARADALRPGQRVSITITLKGESGPRLVVPLSAVVYDQFGGSWVYVRKEEHKYVRERVEVERAAGEWAVLSRGPAKGSQVVRTGVAELFGTEFGAGH
jgi:cobalt-zinc-cadmium efflux system membrane fusion protein